MLTTVALLLRTTWWGDVNDFSDGDGDDDHDDDNSGGDHGDADCDDEDDEQGAADPDVSMEAQVDVDEEDPNNWHLFEHTQAANIAAVFYDRGTDTLKCYPSATRDEDRTMAAMHGFAG